MNEIQMFKNPDFGEIRAVEMNGETWFVGADIASVLGYSNVRDAISRHVDDDDKATVGIHDGRQMRNVTGINESGVYALIFGSTLANAKKFKHWVTSEVLPSIRRNGAYVQPTQAEQTALDIQDRNSRAQLAGVYLALIDHIDTKSETYKPILMAYAANTAAGQNILPLPKSDHTNTYSASQIATMLGVTANKIGRIANANGMKVDEFGQWFHDVASSGKEIDNFRYNEKAIWKFKEILGA